MNIFLLISIALLFTYFLGKFLEKAHIPWIFASLLFGVGLAVYNPFEIITSSGAFNFLAQLGMYFLLFIVGFEINIKKLKHQGKFIIKVSTFTLLLSIVLGIFVVKYFFDVSWLVSLLVSVSFATVGEAILVPILDKLKMINTKIGQSIIGVGTIDDVVEILALLLTTLLIGSRVDNGFIIAGSLIILSLLTFGFTKLGNQGHKFHFSNIQTLFFIIIAVFFFFIGVGEIADAAPLAALLAGVSLQTFISDKRLELIDDEIKSVTYGIFAPIFFLWIGLSIDVQALQSNFLVILAIVVVSALAKIIASVLARGKNMNVRESVLLGIGLSVRFSTGIVIVKIFLDSGFIDERLYSTIIASSVVFTLLVPFVFSKLLNNWKKHISIE